MGGSVRSAPRACPAPPHARPGGPPDGPVSGQPTTSAPAPPPPPLPRRAVLAAPALLAAGPARAAPGPQTRAVTFADGRKEAVFEAGIDLRVTALRGSVPPQWPLELKQAVGPSLKIDVRERGTLSAIYSELREEKRRQAAGDTNRG